MFIESIVIGFVVAIFRKGKIKNIEKININGWYLFLIAGLIQGSISWLKGKTQLLGPSFFENYFYFVHLFTYLLILIGILLNIEKRFMKFIFIGMALNFIVIFANNGKMPVSFKWVKGYEHYTEELPGTTFDIKHSLVSEDTRFIYLADIISIPMPYQMVRIISIGDIFLSIGIYLFFQESMIKKKGLTFN